MSLINNQAEALVSSSNYDCLILGDFNIDYLDRNSCGFKNLKEFERRFLLHQLIETPTRIHNRCCSLIDHIFSNIDNILHKGTIDVSISDHLPTFNIIKKCCKLKRTSSVMEWSYKNYNKEKYQRVVVHDPQWKEYWIQPDVNVKWSIFYEILNREADCLCPVISLKFNLENDGWFTKEVIEAIVEKNRLFKLAKLSKADEDWSIFRAQRKYARKLLLNTKEEFLKNLFFF